MASFIAIVTGLSLVFAALILAIAAEVYYLFWRKKPLAAREIDEANSSYVQELLYILSRRQEAASPLTITSSQSHSSSRGIMNAHHDSDLEMGSSRSLLKPASCEESVESELMRLHNLAGPPRFLFTIKEETREDLDSEDARSRGGDRSRKGSRTRSLSDVIATPFLTPIASPRISSPVLHHPVPVLESYSNQGFNPLYETSSSVEEAALIRMRQSPPPKFKFLRDAEEKLYRRLKEKVMKNDSGPAQDCTKLGMDNHTSSTGQEDQIETLITLISGVKKDKDTSHQHFVHQLNSGSSKVLPLPSSPTGVGVKPPQSYQISQ